MPRMHTVTQVIRKPLSLHYKDNAENFKSLAKRSAAMNIQIMHNINIYYIHSPSKSKSNVAVLYYTSINVWILSLQVHVQITSTGHWRPQLYSQLWVGHKAQALLWDVQHSPTAGHWQQVHYSSKVWPAMVLQVPAQTNDSNFRYKLKMSQLLENNKIT